jgi:hypothetical protein
LRKLFFVSVSGKISSCSASDNNTCSSQHKKPSYQIMERGPLK